MAFGSDEFERQSIISLGTGSPAWSDGTSGISLGEALTVMGIYGSGAGVTPTSLSYGVLKIWDGTAWVIATLLTTYVFKVWDGSLWQIVSGT